MKHLAHFLAVLLMLASFKTLADITLMENPNTSITLRFGERYASTFYTVDGDHFNVVVAFSIGEGRRAQLIRQVFQLTDGQIHQISIGGYGDDEAAVTIKMRRVMERIQAEVITCHSKSEIKDCI
jgi:hypothetical protein